ncbi:MAG: S8 family serine peptidase [Candidatus Omnitrophica bacterium]|nr:S8 family serine peptidase [Candidatus Omnitrophota bacterium]
MSWFFSVWSMKQRVRGFLYRFSLQCLSILILFAVSQTAQSHEIAQEMWNSHPSAAQSKDPSVFHDIGDLSKSDLVFFDGRRSISLSVRDDMAVVRPTSKSKSLDIPTKQKIETGPKSLEGAYNYGWCRTAGAYFLSDIPNQKSLKADPAIGEVFPVFQAGATSWGLSDRICVRFLPGTSQQVIDEIIANNGLWVAKNPSEIGAPGAYDLVVSDAFGTAALDISNSIANHPAVDYCSPDWITITEKFLKPSDPLYPDQWHLESASTPDAVDNSDINVESAWERTLGTGMRVCVIDDGLDYDHEDLTIIRDNSGREIGFDPVDGDNDPRPTLDDPHGTAVGGVIAADINNSKGVVGVAPDAELMGVRVIGYSVTSSDIRDSFLFALANDADLCNNSWGRVITLILTDICNDEDDIFPLPLDPIQRDGLEQLINNGRDGKGCVVLFAAGNSRVDISVDELNGHPDVISVAASNNLAKRSYYSSYGTPIDVCAPSSDSNPIYSGNFCPEIWTGGTLGITTTDVTGFFGYNNSNYGFDFGGTSSACPTVCGVAALILSLDPTQTRLEVQTQLTNTAEKIDTDAGEYDDTGFSIFYGFGRVDAAAAVGSGPVVPTFTPTTPPTRTSTPTPTITPTPSFTPTITNTPTPSFTPTNTFTPTPTFTPRVTQTQVSVAVGGNPVSIDAADLDGVNFEDILTADRSGDGLSVVLNNGLGEFASDAQSIPLGEGTRPSFVATGDLNNDGALDILTIAAGTSQVIALLQSNVQKGTLENEFQIGGKTYVRQDLANLDVERPISAFIGDLNGDNFTDLTLANSEGDDLTVVFGSADPNGLLNGVGERVSSGGRLPVFVTGGVFVQANPTVQLVVTNWEDSTVSIVTVGRNAADQLVSVVSTHSVGVNPRHAVVADYDRDGDNDIAVISQGAPQLNVPIDGSITLLYNIAGTGVFEEADRLVPGGSLLSAAAFDFDKNSFLDLAVSHRSISGDEGRLLIFYNDLGFGVFDPFDGAGQAPLAVTSAALNGGLPPDEDVAVADDLLITNQASNSVSVVTITGDQPKPRVTGDLNLDRTTDSVDLFLFAMLGGQSDPLVRKGADLSGEGMVDANDLIALLEARNTEVPAEPRYTSSAKDEDEAAFSPEAHDTNGDGVVDGADFFTLLE